MGIRNFKKALLGGLAALVLTAGLSCKHPSPNQPEPDRPTPIPITIEYNSYYTPYKCSSAEIRGDFTGWNVKNMKKNSENRFSYEDTVKQGNYLFNIESFVDTTGSSANFNYTNEWIVSGRWYPGPDSFIIHGTRAEHVKFKDTVLNNSYLVKNNLGGGNFSVSVSDQGISPGPGQHAPIYDEIPPETQCKTWYIQYSTPQDYNSSWNNGIAWMQAISISGTSEIRVNYTRFGARLSNGQDTLLASYEYNGGSFEPPFRYLRYPWFVTDEHEQASSNISNGYMIFRPSDNPNRVYHWWSPRATVPANAEYCWLECEVKINGLGKAGVQPGIDFRPSQNQLWPIVEAGAGNWRIGPGTYHIKLILKK